VADIDYAGPTFTGPLTGGGGGGGAPADAQYLVLALNAVLTQERLFTPGLGLAGVDGGANAPYTLNSTTWDRIGTVVQLVTPTDTVAIGAAAMFGAEVVRIVGDTRIEGKLTVTGVIDPTALFLSDPAAGTALFVDSADGQTAPVSGANHGRLRYNDTIKLWESSQDTSPYAPFGTVETGWTRDAATPAVRLTTVTDPVGIGTAAPAAGLKVDVTGTAGRQGLRSTTGLATDVAFASRVTGDGFDRFAVVGTAVAAVDMRLGGGALAADVSLARGGVGQLWVNGPIVGASDTGSLVVSGTTRLSTGLQSYGVGNGAVIGAARGVGAVDLQFSRLAATQVAAGARSAIGGGTRNRISAAGTDGMIPGGTDNVVTAPTGFAAGDSNTVTAASGQALGLGNSVTAPFGTAIGQTNSVGVTSGWGIGRGVSVVLGTDEGTGGIGSLLTVAHERAQVFGYQASSEHPGTETWAAGQFGATRGNAQHERVNWRGIDTLGVNDGILHEIFLAGGAPVPNGGSLAGNTPYIVSPNSSYGVDIKVVGHRTNAAGTVTATATFWFATTIRRSTAAATTVMDGLTAPYRTVQSPLALATAAVVDQFGDTLRVQVKGQIAGQVWRWNVLGDITKAAGTTT
jgi:hypothetical protein